MHVPGSCYRNKKMSGASFLSKLFYKMSEENMKFILKMTITFLITNTET